jgi:cellulose synthase/poly-beta-1,6-N-acetylglucosamine synthase-like glycosyltransferase
VTDAAVELPRQAVEFTYSVVIPVFNSEELVGGVVEGLLDTFAGAGLQLEVICVNDGSVDRSWDVIAGLAEAHPNVVAVDLLRNYGQHNANLAGWGDRRLPDRWTTTAEPARQTLRLIAAIVELATTSCLGFDSKSQRAPASARR